MGFSHVLRLCLQGGGVYIGGGTVSFSLCTITGNTAYYVRAHLQKFPSPRWENCSHACFDSRLHNCERFGQLQNVRAAETCNFPSTRWEFLLTCPIDSHLSIRIDIWFYQGNVRASHACKLPIAPMGKLLTCLP